MKPINNFENVQAFSTIENLPAGGYVCEIKKCEEKPNKNGGSHLEMLFEIAEGEYKNWFKKDWDNQTRAEKFWRGIYNQNEPAEGSQNYEIQVKFFKAFVNAIEDSNPNYHWDWNETGLKGKKIGIVFGEREKISSRGTKYTITSATSVVSVGDIKSGNFKTPDVKRIEAAPAAYSQTFETLDVDDGDLPF